MGDTIARFTLSAAALRDATRIAEHLSKEAGERIAARFANQLERLLDGLRSMPGQGRETSRRGTYVILMKRFPYHDIYQKVGPNEFKVVRVRYAGL